MTFIYIVKKVAKKWLENMAKSQMARSLVVQETLSINSARQAFKTEHQISLINKDK